MKCLKKSFCVFICVLLAFSSFFALYSYALDGVYYDLQDGYLYVSGSGAMERTFAGNLSVEEVYISRGVTSVPAEAFRGCANLETVTLSNTVVSLGASAFRDCTSLIEVKMSKNIETVSAYAFCGCESLTDIKIPDSAVKIEAFAFADCTALEYAVITKDVAEIESGAFDNCASLNTVYYAGTQGSFQNLTADENCFGNAEINCISPVLSFSEAYTGGNSFLYVNLVSGNLSAFDSSFQFSGNADSYMFLPQNSFTGVINMKDRLISVASSQNANVGEAIFSIRYNLKDCSDFYFDMTVNDCYALAGKYQVEVPAVFEGGKLTGSHNVSEWSVTKIPGAEEDGEISSVCDKCGTFTKILPYLLKNCTVNENIALIYDYAASSEAFRNSYVALDGAEITPSSSDIVGTGTKVSKDYGDGITVDYDVAVSGDVDGDGYCDGQDSVIIMCICEGLLDADSLNECVKLAADCAENSAIDSDDAVFAQQNGIFNHS